ncbi:MAG: protein arginine kinase [Candidatus Methylacidiphilales bacterium]|nr:protein arginine kinase [Candidatus Methylacidiphilales bacterium]
MKITNLLNTSSEWLKGDGGSNRIVISTRIRLARNIANTPFPGWAKKAERERILGVIQPAVASMPEMNHAIINDSMEHFSPLEKQVLVEQHLISREHAAKNAGSGLVVNKPRTLSVMINEEDHLRIQAIKSGQQLKTLWKMVEKIDAELEDELDFAFSPQIGYLTACPTNVGTGMRASVMMHLPGLVLSDQITQIIKAVNRIGLAVRGLYGEGTEALGNLFQVSNQMTLGESEAQILERLTKVINQIIEHEENARQRMLQDKARMVADQVGRAYGVMMHSYSITSKEVLNLLSLLRLGVDLGMLPEEYRVIIDELFIRTQPAHLQKDFDRKLTTEERDGLRSDLLRTKLKSIPVPNTKGLVEGFSSPDDETPGTKKEAE